jgi:hypothetical protein
MRFVHVVLSLGVVLTQVDCDAGPSDEDSALSCTEASCSDAATITTKLSAAGAPLGTHSFALEIDGAPQTCTVEFVTETEVAYGQCSGEASLSFGPVIEVTTINGENVEEPIPGEFRWQIDIEAQPAEIQVVHTHAGNTFLDQTASFTYMEHRPNGPDCEPVCMIASVEWTGP